MKRFLIPSLLVLSTISMAAEPWKIFLKDSSANITLKADLYEESIEVPGMEMFGKLNGYMLGPGLYGTWYITSCNIISDTQATIRLTNDFGSETQEIRLSYPNDSTLVANLTGGVCMKRVVDKRKLQKIGSTLSFKVNKAAE